MIFDTLALLLYSCLQCYWKYWSRF